MIIRRLFVTKHWTTISRTFDQPIKAFSSTAGLSSSNEGQDSNAISLEGRDVLSLKRLRREEIKQIIWTARDLKTRIKENGEIYQPLSGRSAVMLFKQDNSLKKELVSVELGLSKLGGQAVYCGPLDIDLNGIVKDAAREFAGAADCIIATGFLQETVNTLANECTSPVVSGYTDVEHPVQALAYLLTLQEHFNYLMGCKVAWIGDGNSVLNSLMYGCAKLGMDLSIATPMGREPNTDAMLEAIKIAGNTSASIQYSNKPVEAVYRADAIITDPWDDDANHVRENRDMSSFHGFEVNRKMLKEAGGSWVTIHRLPRLHGEMADDVFYGKESLVWQAAENRMWVSMAVLLNLITACTPSTPMPKFVKGK